MKFLQVFDRSKQPPHARILKAGLGGIGEGDAAMGQARSPVSSEDCSFARFCSRWTWSQ
jgi:hypothetical protein